MCYEDFRMCLKVKPLRILEEKYKKIKVRVRGRLDRFPI
jgi:hypothetical protein